MSDLPFRAHVVTGGFPPGQMAGHDHDYARIRILEILERQGIRCSVANDFVDVERWLPTSRLMISYVAGPVLGDPQAEMVEQWMAAGGRWLALHGTSGGKAVRVEGTRQRKMVKLAHHRALGGFFINHPPVRRFTVDLADDAHPLVRGVPAHFEVIDEPYMIEVADLQGSKVLLTAELGPDPGPPGFGFVYEADTALLADGKTRVIAYQKDVGEGGVAYIALGHAHAPDCNVQPFVERNVDPEGKTPPLLRQTWETKGFQKLLENGAEWGMARA
jgi:hypothetical protein